MSTQRLTFVLDGRDDLSRVLGHAGDSATRLRNSMTDAADGSNRAILTLTRDADGNLRDLQGRFVSTADAARLMAHQTGTIPGPLNNVTHSANRSSSAIQKLKMALISLSPAAIPVAASLGPIAAGAGAGAVAVLAFTAALIPQISAMSDAAAAEKKFTEAVAEHGPASKEAADAQAKYLRVVAKLPPETRKAAAAFSVFKDEYKEWSTSLAPETMRPIVSGMALFTGLLPKTSGLVRGTSNELNRMVTILAGGMQSPGFDRLNKRFEEFATGTLRKVNDALVKLLTTSDGSFGDGFSEFMEYARANGPLVGDTLTELGRAMAHLLVAASDMGVGILQAVNVLAKLVNAVPTGVLSTFLQLYAVMKLLTMGATMLGAATGSAAAARLGAYFAVMRAAGVATTLRATAASMSLMAKASIGLGVVAVAAVAIDKLAEKARGAPPDVDKLTTSLKNLSTQGKFTGELKATFGDMDGFVAKVQKMRAETDALDKATPFTSLIGMGPIAEKLASKIDDLTRGSNSLTATKEDYKAFDETFASLATSGHADLAAAQFKRFETALRATGMSTKEIAAAFPAYTAAVAGIKAEQELAARAMGLFGVQAQQVQAKLAAQKQSSDGLRQSIHALNDAYLMMRGGARGMEAAIDAASAAAKENGRTLDINTDAGRRNQEALDNVASTTMRNAEAARDNGAAWSTVNGIYARGRAKLIESAMAMGLTKDKAAALANQILRTPDKTARLRGNMEDLQAKLNHAKNQLSRVPDSRRASVRARIDQLEAAIRRARGQLDALDGKVANTYVTTTYKVVGKPAGHAGPGGFPKYADGGRPKPGWAWVGEEGPELVRFKGGEQVYDHRTSASMASAPQGMSMAGAGQAAGRGLSAGLVGSVSGVEAAARVMAAAVVTGVRDELEIASPSKKMKALAADTGKGMIIGLTGSKGRIAAVAKDLVKDIWAAWKGTPSGKDSSLVRMVNRDTVKLQRLAHQRDTLGVRILEAKKYANDLAASTRQGAELGSLGLQPEEVSTGSIMGGLAGKLGQIRTFTRAVGELAKKGLNKTLLRQILNMGPDAGYAYANALAAADKGTLGQLNSLQAELDKSATALGMTGADALYDSGKNAGKGFLAGLISEQKAIEAQMLKIAVAMQKAIKRALGIKSPSQVMAQLGKYSTEGLAVGLVHGIPHLDKALGTVTGRVAAARPVIGRPAAAGGGSGSMARTVIHNEIHVHGAIDPTSVGRQIETVLVKYQRDNGGAVLNFKTRA